VAIIIFILHKSLINNNIYFFIIVIIITIFIPFYYYFHINTLFIHSNTTIKAQSQGQIIKCTDHRYEKRCIAQIDGAKILIYNCNKKIKKNDHIKLLKDLKVSIKHNNAKSFSQLLIKKGIFHCLYKNENYLIKEDTSTLLQKTRRSIEKKIMTLYSQSHSGFVKALILGNKNSVQKNRILNYKKSGTFHILSASGLHVTIIALIPFFFFSFIGFPKKGVMLLSGGTIIGYILITDVPVSLLRAGLMCIIYSYGYCRGFKTEGINIICSAALIILMFHPFELYSAGFQLSFGATTGIILFYQKYDKILSIFHKRISSSISLSLAAQSIVYPILLFHFKSLNSIGILTGLLIIPVIMIFLPLALLSIALGYINTKGALLLVYITQKIALSMDTITQTAALIPGHTSLKINIPIAFVGYILLLLPLFIKKGSKHIKCVMLLVSLIIITLSISQKDNRSLIIYGQKSIIAHMNNKVTFIGTPVNYKEIRAITNHIEGYNKPLHIILPLSSSYKNIRFLPHLLKKIPVSQCTIAKDCYPGTILVEILKILEKDSISPQFTNIHSMKKIENIASLFTLLSLQGHLKERDFSSAKITPLFSKEE